LGGAFYRGPSRSVKDSHAAVDGVRPSIGLIERTGIARRQRPHLAVPAST
jgi:hypothetical protein